VLRQDNGDPLTRTFVQARMKRASRRAGLPHDGLHIRRHSFCSHLAMRGAPARAIQELAGHADLTMTQRYMHLTPTALDAAIRLLEQPNGPAQTRGSLQTFEDYGDGQMSLG
jgi:site-specific recombinase XerD